MSASDLAKCSVIRSAHFSGNSRGCLFFFSSVLVLQLYTEFQSLLYRVNNCMNNMHNLCIIYVLYADLSVVDA